VVVAGGGPLVAPLATALAAAGIGHVEPVVEGIATYADVAVGGLACDDVDASRAIATSTAIVRFAPGVNVSPVRSDTVDFVVRVGDRNPPALARRGFRLNALPRLEVTIRLGTVLVGPLVRPAASPCGQCLDRHRADRDPAWPALSAQLSTAKTDAGEPCAITTAMAGAAFAADEVLAYIDGLPLRTEAAIVEISRPGELRRREWTAHPRCDCRRRRRTTPSGTGGSG
jgi:bacteriocin biosynthesis cyclodehydratase domain-containing protein